MAVFFLAEGMIVNYTKEGWEIVTQRAHGILAAAIAMQWKKNQRPDRWLETLLAIAEHDDAEIELDGENLLTDTGGPLNYAMKTFDLAHCEKLERMTITKSRYITLLTSTHMEFLYGKQRSTSKSANRFLQQQEKLRHSLEKELEIAPAQLQKTYDLMEWCDAFSLLLCENQLQTEKRATEISTGPDKRPYEVITIGEEALSVEPWPFETNGFSIQFEKRLLQQLSFASSADFRKHFMKAEIRVASWTIKKSVKNVRTSKKKVKE